MQRRKVPLFGTPEPRRRLGACGSRCRDRIGGGDWCWCRGAAALGADYSEAGCGLGRRIGWCSLIGLYEVVSLSAHGDVVKLARGHDSLVSTTHQHFDCRGVKTDTV